VHGVTYSNRDWCCVLTPLVFIAVSDRWWPPLDIDSVIPKSVRIGVLFSLQRAQRFSLFDVSTEKRRGFGKNTFYAVYVVVRSRAIFDFCDAVRVNCDQRKRLYFFCRPRPTNNPFETATTVSFHLVEFKKPARRRNSSLSPLSRSRDPSPFQTRFIINNFTEKLHGLVGASLSRNVKNFRNKRQFDSFWWTQNWEVIPKTAWF